MMFDEMLLRLTMESQILFYFLLPLLFFFISKHLLRVHKNLPPSPGISLPLIGHLYHFKKPLHRSLAKLSSKYGPILFLKFGSRPVVLVSSSSIAAQCFTKHDITFANRPKLLAGKYIGYNYSSLIWASYGQHWRNLRRIASLEILSSHRIHMLTQIRVDEVKSMLRRLFRNAKHANSAVKVDMKRVFSELTLNIMLTMIAGKRHYGESETEFEREKSIVIETFRVNGNAGMGDFMPILKWVGLNKIKKIRLKGLQRKRDAFMQGLIEERRRKRSQFESEDRNNKTMIDVLLGLQETEPEYYSDAIIRGLIQVMLSAGMDTSALTMEWALSLLLNNPDALRKVQNEIQASVGTSRFLRESDLPNLPYLNGVINETLRMCPAAPLNVPHESSEDCVLNDFHVPRGTMLLVNVWAIHNDPILWEDPRTFRPERFVLDGDKSDGLVSKLLLPFGAGRRRCPGEGLAMRVIGLALGSLIQSFEWERIGEEPIDMTEGPGFAMPKAMPLVAMYRPTPIMLNLLSQLCNGDSLATRCSY